MKKLFSLLALAVALVAGLWVDWRRWNSDEAVQPDGSSELSSEANSASELERTKTEPAQERTGDERTSVSSSAVSGAGRGGIQLSGTLTLTGGGEVPRAHSRVTVLDEHGEEITGHLSGDTSYEFESLHPGHWWVFAGNGRLSWHRATIDLHPGDVRRTLDFELEPLSRLEIRLVSPSGEPMHVSPDENELDGSRKTKELEFVATRVPMIDIVPLGARSRSAEFVVSRALRRRSYIPPNVDKSPSYTQRDSVPPPHLLTTTSYILDAPPDIWGYLEMNSPLPLYVSAVCGDAIVRSQLVPRGATSVTFTLTSDDPLALPARVRLRVIVGETNLPAVGVNVNLGSRPRKHGSTDTNGEIAFEHVEPGWTELRVWNKELSLLEEYVRILPNFDNDLGQRVLTQPATIRGTVIDDDGKPIATTVHVEPLVREPDTGTRPINLDCTADGTGAFEMRFAARGRVLVHADEWYRVVAPVVVDARVGTIDGVLLQMAPPARLAILLPRDISANALLTITTADGTPVAREDTVGRERFDMRLAPGSYIATIHDGGRRVLSRSFEATPEGLTLDLGP